MHFKSTKEKENEENRTQSSRIMNLSVTDTKEYVDCKLLVQVSCFLKSETQILKIEEEILRILHSDDNKFFSVVLWFCCQRFNLSVGINQKDLWDSHLTQQENQKKFQMKI